MDAETMDAVAGVVQKMTDNDEMFTAFDVTHVVRCTVDPSIPHYQIKKAVHDMFGNGQLPNDYVRSTVDINLDSKQVGAFVYHPNWKDANTYDAKRFQDIDSDPFDQSGKSILPPAAQQNSSNVSAVGQKGKDQRGRICVPAPLIRKIGKYPGNTVYVIPFLSEVEVHAHDPGDGLVAASYTVDKSGNVRISRKWMGKVALSGASNFVVATSRSDEKIIKIS